MSKGIYIGEYEGLRQGEPAFAMVGGVAWDTVRNAPLDEEGVRRERAAAIERDRYTAELRARRCGVAPTSAAAAPVSDQPLPAGAFP